MRFNRKSFFAGYRELWGSLSQSQVDGLEFLLGAIEQDPKWESVQQISYFLATIQHETARTFQPIKEVRERKDSPRRASQDRYWLTDFYGRGYVQITWKKNYERFGIGGAPDKALEPETAYRIAANGMREGLFTSLSLDDFINDDKTDYVNARKVINGLDKANEIAKNAKHFEAILTVAAEKEEVLNEPAEPPDLGGPSSPPEDKGEQKVEPPAAPQAPKPEVTPIAPPKGSIITKIAAAASAAGPVIGATGLKIGGVEFKTGGLIAFAAVLIVGMIIGAWLYNEDRKRRREEQKESMMNLADPNRANIVAAGSKV